MLIFSHKHEIILSRDKY